MTIATAYAQTPKKTPVNTLIISHFDSHGVSYAASRARVLSNKGETVEIVAKFPETGPQGFSSGQVKQLLDPWAPQRIEIIDIPVDVRNPDAAVKTLTDLATMAPIYYYDHHETDVPFLPRLHQAGVYASVFGDNVAMAAALELLTDDHTRELAIVGAVADRDSSVLKLVPRDEVENKYLQLANKLDVIVRQPQLENLATPGDVAKRLASAGTSFLADSPVSYPPETLARELESKIVESEGIAVLVDWRDMEPQASMWVPKTLEQLLIHTRKSIAVAITPAFNPRTKVQEGYDIKVLKYWLASDAPTPEDIARELITTKALEGNVVGHSDYISIRFTNIVDALNAARTLYKAIEGTEPRTIHLVNDRLVAQAVRRDFSAILERLERILQQQAEMYKQYLELKRKQVELLERSDNRSRYD